MKKIKEVLKKLKPDTKFKKFITTQLVLIVIVFLFLIFTGSFAYLGNLIGDGINTITNINSYNPSERRFFFTPHDPVPFGVSTSGFADGSGSITNEKDQLATLIKGEAESSATENYSVYVDLSNNTFIYTTAAKTAELLLNVVDPEGNEVTSIAGLTRVTVTDATGKSYTGFDITEINRMIRIIENRSITTTSQKEEEWTMSVTFVDLPSSQTSNANKDLDIDIHFQKEAYPHLIVNAENTYYIGPNVSFDCEGAGARWDAATNSLIVSSLNAVGECTLTQNKNESATPLDDYIVSLSGTTQGTGEVVNENGYRYEGKNPNNYIWFNEELWRVIGVFDTVLADGTTTERLTKIIKADSIGSYAWDSENVNNWNESTLKALLNTSYLNSENGTGTENCYGYRASVPTNCDYTQNGIKNEYKSMIENVTWNLGGFSSSSTAASAVFAAERGTTVYTGNPTTGTGYIGLMYPSDYMYSSLESSCSRTTTFNNYDSSSCAGANWMYGEGYEWTLAPVSSSSVLAWDLRNGGYGNGTDSRSGDGVRPVLYLNSEVKYLDGAGSEADPLIVEM